MATIPDREINPAKRGDLFVFPITHSVMYLNAPQERRVTYVLAIVTSITREGLIKGYHIAGDLYDSRGTPADTRLISQTHIQGDAAVRAYINRGEAHNRDFATLDEAKAFLKSFLKVVDNTDNR